MGDLVIPAKLADHRRSRGRATSARDWLARLPALVAEVAEAVGPRGGRSARARRQHLLGGARCAAGRDGLDAVLKVQLPHPESAPEAVGLRAWAGDGAVRLLRPRPRAVGAADRALPARARPRRRRGHRSRRSRAGAAIGARLHAVRAARRAARRSSDVLGLVGRRPSRSTSSSGRRPTRAWPAGPSTTMRERPAAHRAPGAAARRPQPHQRAGGASASRGWPSTRSRWSATPPTTVRGS